MFNPDASLLAIAESVVTLWDTGTGELVNQLPYGTSGRQLSIAFSPDSKQLAIAHEFQVTIVSIETGGVLREFSGGAPIYWSANGDFVIYTKDVEAAINTIGFRNIAVNEDIAVIEYPLRVLTKLCAKR